MEDQIRALEDEKSELLASSSDHARPLMRCCTPRCALCNALQHQRATLSLQFAMLSNLNRLINGCMQPCACLEYDCNPMVACRQIECMAASASAQQAAHAEAEQQLLERLKSAEASLAGFGEAEQALKEGRPF